jgi:hypothetical protein
MKKATSGCALYAIFSLYPGCMFAYEAATLIENRSLFYAILFGIPPFLFVAATVLFLMYVDINDSDQLYTDEDIRRLRMNGALSLILMFISLIIAVYFGAKILNETPDEIWGLSLPYSTEMIYTSWFAGFFSGLSALTLGRNYLIKNLGKRSADHPISILADGE